MLTVCAVNQGVYSTEFKPQLVPLYTNRMSSSLFDSMIAIYINSILSFIYILLLVNTIRIVYFRNYVIEEVTYKRLVIIQNLEVAGHMISIIYKVIFDLYVR